MKLYEIVPLFEARSNPELNPRLGAVEQLRQYKDDPNVYISFTNINKIGIFPRSSGGEAPIGIYAFPLKQCWELYNVDKEQNFFKFPSIGRHRPFIHILRFSGQPKFINVQNYTHDNFQSDSLKLKSMFEGEQYDYVFGKKGVIWDNFTPEPFILLYQGICQLVGHDAAKWNHTLRALGYSGFNDNTGLGWIHEAEPYQTVFLSKSAVNHIGVIDNVNYDIKNLSMHNPKSLSVQEMIDITDEHRERIQKFEPYILQDGTPEDIIGYITAATIHRPWPAAEAILMKDPYYAMYYATEITHHRFKLAEPVIKKSPYWVSYANYFGIKE